MNEDDDIYTIAGQVADYWILGITVPSVTCPGWYYVRRMRRVVDWPDRETQIERFKQEFGDRLQELHIATIKEVFFDCD